MHGLRKARPLRRVVLAGATTVCGMVLLLALKPHANHPVAAGAPVAGPPAPTSAPSASASASATAPATGSTKTVTGDSVQTPYGPVQVRVTLQKGRLTDVTAVVYPQQNPRDQEIASYSLPQLRQEALTAQNAQIDAVSGATYTSDGYIQSLQSALDRAGG